MSSSKAPIFIEVAKFSVISILLFGAFFDAEPGKAFAKPLMALVSAGFVALIYASGKNLAVTYGRKLKTYLLVLYLSGLGAVMMSSAYGTHVEDADFGGGESVQDFIPTKAEKANYAIFVFLIFLAPGLYGVSRGPDA